MQKTFQVVSLGPGCVHHGVVLHELLHALGFWHEQSRYVRVSLILITLFSSVKLRTDRDKHVRILWENIEMGREDQFARWTFKL